MQCPCQTGPVCWPWGQSELGPETVPAYCLELALCAVHNSCQLYMNLRPGLCSTDPGMRCPCQTVPVCWLWCMGLVCGPYVTHISAPNPSFGPWGQMSLTTLSYLDAKPLQIILSGSEMQPHLGWNIRSV